MVMNLTHQNMSLAPTDTLHWDLSFISDVFGFSIGTLSNATVLFLLLFLRHQLPAFAFNAYLVNILIANIYHDLPGPLLLFFIKISPSAKYSSSCCTLYLYTNFTSIAVVTVTHLLITLSRLWAAVFPHSYRVRHTTKMAVALCFGAWLYGSTLTSAFVILDTVYYRLSAEEMAGRCFLDTKSLYSLSVAALVLYLILPMAVITTAFPVLWFKCRRIVTKSTIARRFNGRVDNEHSNGTAGATATKREHRTAFIVYFALTLSIIIFWTPVTITYSMRVLILTPAANLYIFLQISFFLFHVQTVIDPVLLVCFNREWRNTFKQHMFCWHR